MVTNKGVMTCAPKLVQIPQLEVASQSARENVECGPGIRFYQFRQSSALPDGDECLCPSRQRLLAGKPKGAGIEAELRA